MKGRSCYTTHDNSEVTLCHAVVVVPVSTQTHPTCIHKYYDLCYWWTAEVRPGIEEACDSGDVFCEELDDC